MSSAHRISVDLLGVVAPGLTVVQCLPQALRLRARGGDGVSLATWVLTIAVAEIWLAFGAVFVVPAEIVANIPYLAASAAVLFLAARAQRQLPVALAGSAAATLGAASLGVAAALGPGRAVLAAAADASAIGLYLPQLVKAVRDREVAGISPAAWLLAAVTALCWGAYGVLIHQVVVAVPTLVTAPTSLAIVAVALLRRPAPAARDGSGPASPAGPAEPPPGGRGAGALFGE